ncbi:MAG: PHP domain-containing protein [bacterium]|nr:PHP domain-containing protein [bacterium]
MLIDLHMHTNRSDGVWSVERLLDEVDARALDLFCISDHDTLAAYPLPRSPKARCIPGLEVDTHHGGHTTHLLAYGIADPESPLLRALGAQRAARAERMAEMVEAMQRQGIAVTMADVEAQVTAGASYGRPHLARALVACGAVSSVQEAFDRYLADDGVSYVPLARLTAREAIALVRDSGGVSVVAHPARLREPGDLLALIELGVDGIEIAHPTADEAYRAAVLALARERELLVTGGTDFHAPVEDRPIGVAFPDAEVERLISTLEARAAQ